MEKELWTIYHGYTVDGGFGDAIWREDMLGLVSASQKEIADFVAKYDAPVVYDKPYDRLTCHHIRAEKVEVHDISYFEKHPYGKSDYYGRCAKEFELDERYVKQYGVAWWNDKKILEQHDRELEDIRKEFEKETEE